MLMAPPMKPLTTNPVIVLLSPLMKNAPPEASMLPLIATSGPFRLVSPVNIVCVLPSIRVLLRTVGNADDGLIVNTPPAKPGSVAGMLKMTLFGPELAAASVIAWRSDPAPPSFVLVTTKQLSRQNCSSIESFCPIRLPAGDAKLRDSPATYRYVPSLLAAFARSSCAPPKYVVPSVSPLAGS